MDDKTLLARINDYTWIPTSFLAFALIVDLNDWGIGINVGKSKWSNKVYINMNILCFGFICWIGEQRV